MSGFTYAHLQGDSSLLSSMRSEMGALITGSLSSHILVPFLFRKTKHQSINKNKQGLELQFGVTVKEFLFVARTLVTEQFRRLDSCPMQVFLTLNF